MNSTLIGKEDLDASAAVGSVGLRSCFPSIRALLTDWLGEYADLLLGVRVLPDNAGLKLAEEAALAGSFLRKDLSFTRSKSRMKVMG